MKLEKNISNNNWLDEALQFRTEGIVYIRNFYDLISDILPIQKDIYQLIGLIIAKHGLPINQAPFSPENFDSGLSKIIASNRDLAGVLYDAVKKIPSYVRLANCWKHNELAKDLLQTDFIGFANRGYGIRLDHPKEDKFLTQWHQDYVSQLCSPRGVVMWSPLRDVSKEMGPVEICPKSHTSGIYPIVRDGVGSYGLKVDGIDKIIEKLEAIAPEVRVGDCVVIDFMTLHRSLPNRSVHTRWAMISRYFDFLEEVGISNGWKGGLQDGNSFEQIHPDLSRIIS